MTDHERYLENLRYSYRCTMCRTCDRPLEQHIQEQAFTERKEQDCVKCRNKKIAWRGCTPCCKEAKIQPNPGNAYLLIAKCPIHGEKRYGSSE